MRTFTFKTLWNKYGDQIEQVLGLDKHQLEQDYEEYTTKLPVASDKDYIWSLFNRMLFAAGNDYFTQSRVYHSMAVFVSAYECKNGNQYKRLSLEAEVNYAKEENKNSSLVMDIEVIADLECGHAKSLDGVLFPLDDKLVMPLANEQCERELCRCTTTCIGRRNESGRLVQK